MSSRANVELNMLRAKARPLLLFYAPCPEGLG